MAEQRVKAVALRQKGQTLYLFRMNSDDLGRMSYVTPRSQDNPDEIQRLLHRPRAREIGEYIQQELSLFPNAIVVSLESDVRIEPTGDPDEVTIVFPTTDGKHAYILDGQHRLAGFQYSNGIHFDLPVVALHGAPQSLRGKLFADINSKQVKVSDVQLLDLYYGLRMLPGDEDATVSVVMQLARDDDSPLKGLVQTLPDQKGTWVKNTALTKWLGPHTKPGGVLSTKAPAEQATIFKAYYGAVSDMWPDAWGDNKGHLLTKPFGIEVMAGAFRAVKTRVDLRKGRQYTRSNFHEMLEPLRNVQIRPFGAETDLSIPLTWESGALGRFSNAPGRTMVTRQLVDALQQADEDT